MELNRANTQSTVISPSVEEKWEAPLWQTRPTLEWKAGQEVSSRDPYPVRDIKARAKKKGSLISVGNAPHV